MNEKHELLKKNHPSISYLSYEYSLKNSHLLIEYTFLLAPNIYFHPKLKIPISSVACESSLIDRIIFLTGIVELISYWKSACPPEILIKCGELDEYEIDWWLSLFKNGLGEFFYINKLSPSIPLRIKCFNSEKKLININLSEYHKKYNDSHNSLLLVGGGKDSIVTLELFKEYSQKTNLKPIAVCLNPIKASLETIEIAGIEDTLLIERTIDNKLFELNSSGYLNGHTPFSAFLSFATTILALVNNAKQILVSNESSASEGNVSYNGMEINHQYSKSYHYEKQFREYSKHIGITVNYHSTLRALNELQISGIFSKYPKYFKSFKSCNITQTLKAREDSNMKNWCGSCPKCLFTFLCLSCFLEIDELIEIFGSLIAIKPENIVILKDLCGLGETKPFECVGTAEESTTGLFNFIRKYKNHFGNPPEILSELEKNLEYKYTPVKKLLSEWNYENFIPKEFQDLLKYKLENILNKV